MIEGKIGLEAVPEQSVIVWDLETVPDLAAAARMLDLGHATDEEVRQAIGPGFPKHPLHKIVCIGALIASRLSVGWRLDALGAPLLGERPEPKSPQDSQPSSLCGGGDCAAAIRHRDAGKTLSSFPLAKCQFDPFQKGIVVKRKEARH